LLLKGQVEGPELGQGEVEMSETNPDFVQEQLSELAQQVVHRIQACDEEKGLLEEELDSVRNGILIMESRLQTEKIRIDSKVSGVGSMVNLLQAALQQLCSRIHMLQSQDNQRVSEATDLFAGMRQELEAQSKRISVNSLQVLAIKTSTQSVQKGLSALTKRIDEVNKAMAGITTTLKNIPTKRELREHQDLMDDQLAQVEEINTGLTTAMEAYKVSESTPFQFEQVAEPSGTQQYVHPQRRSALEQ